MRVTRSERDALVRADRRPLDNRTTSTRKPTKDARIRCCRWESARWAASSEVSITQQRRPAHSTDIPPERFELPTPWVVARCSCPLSYGGVFQVSSIVGQRQTRRPAGAKTQAGRKSIIAPRTNREISRYSTSSFLGDPALHAIASPRSWRRPRILKSFGRGMFSEYGCTKYKSRPDGSPKYLGTVGTHHV